MRKPLAAFFGIQKIYYCREHILSDMHLIYFKSLSSPSKYIQHALKSRRDLILAMGRRC
jgi:hypothetical protein